jgi:hypothetical protein
VGQGVARSVHHREDVVTTEADRIEDMVKAERLGVDRLPVQLSAAYVREHGAPSRREARALLGLPPLTVVAATDPAVVTVLAISCAVLLVGCDPGSGSGGCSFGYSKSTPPPAAAPAPPPTFVPVPVPYPVPSTVPVAEPHPVDRPPMADRPGTHGGHRIPMTRVASTRPVERATRTAR